MDPSGATGLSDRMVGRIAEVPTRERVWLGGLAAATVQ